MTNILMCEDEEIHLCGKIQNFGYLLVFDSLYNCVGVSENFFNLIGLSVNECLGKTVDFFQNYFKVNVNLDIDYLKNSDKENKIDHYNIQINDIEYRLAVYIQAENIFFEFEPDVVDSSIDLKKLKQLQNEVELSSNVWQKVCDTFYDIIAFDRIMVYQFAEDNTGVVIAESIHGNLSPVLGFRYPEFDIPLQARELYAKNLNRQTANIYADTVNIIGLKHSEVDLSKSKIRALSPVHLQYLHNSQVTASASFSIIINDKLWGLVCCQHQVPKYITINERKLCSSIVSAASKVQIRSCETLKKAQVEFVNEIERELKQKLLYSHNLYETLSQFSNRFSYLLTAKGIILISNDTIFSHGIIPEPEIFEEIRKDLDQRVKHNQVFTTYKFSKIKKNLNIDTSDFSGIARINFDKDGKYAIYFFRPEIIKEETWAGEPEKFLNFSVEDNATSYSPRTSFEAWKKQVLGESQKWSEYDLTFLNTLCKLVSDSIFRQKEEKKLLDQRLSFLNRSCKSNEINFMNLKVIDDFEKEKEKDYFKKSIEGLDEAELANYTNTILETSFLTEYIISKTIDKAIDNPNNSTYNFICIEKLISDIIEEAKNEFPNLNINIEIGNLLSLNVDRTLLYELFKNIIFNAFKFSRAHSQIIISITSQRANNKIVYLISDNGIGIESENNSSPFTIFKKMPNAKSYVGHGIGLATAKRIADRINANISYETEVGKGTTFKIIFNNE